MDKRIDEALRDLKAADQQVRLDQLEPRVWARVEALRVASRDGGLLLPLRAGAVAVAMAFGVAVGGLGASEARAQRQDVSVFSVETQLAPSTLLEGL